MEYTVKVNKHFKWVLDWLEYWKEENKTGEIRLVFKDGGVAGMTSSEYIKPPKNEESILN